LLFEEYRLNIVPNGWVLEALLCFMVRLSVQHFSPWNPSTVNSENVGKFYRFICI